MSSKLIAYALDFSSFLLQKIKDKNEIKNIILFGSVTRDESSSSSDIDIFIDLIKDKKSTEKEIKIIGNKFYDSTRYKNYWAPLGVNNKISLIVGELDKWKELKPSIIANGITLYGKFKSDIKGELKVFFIWENVQPNSSRVLFNKQMLGYNQKDRFYLGLIQKYKGERLGKGCILVPIEQSNVFHNLFKKYKIAVKIKKVVEM